MKSECTIEMIRFLVSPCDYALSTDYVCIGQVALLEMGLRLGQAQEGVRQIKDATF